MADNKFRILSFQGGGVKGTISAASLVRLEEACPGLVARTDLFAGTSTGGIIALMLACGNSPNDVTERYLKQARSVFHASMWRRITGSLGLIRAKYGNEYLKSELDKEFGNLKIGDLPRNVVIPSADLENKDIGRWGMSIFSNSIEPDTLIRDVALFTTAAPTYFPSHMGYVDGALFANNPSSLAYEYAINNLGVHPDDILILHFGTGDTPWYIGGDHHDWGLIQWSSRIINLLMFSNGYAADRQCSSLLGDRYCKHDVPIGLDNDVGLDDAKAVDMLVKIANEVDLAYTVNWLFRHLW